MTVLIVIVCLLVLQRAKRAFLETQTTWVPLASVQKLQRLVNDKLSNIRLFFVMNIREGNFGYLNEEFEGTDTLGALIPTVSSNVCK